MSGIETAAGTILKRAVELDNKKRYTEALVCYQEGLQLLVNSMKDEENAFKKQYLRKKIEEYMNRAELIKNLINEQKDSGIFHEQIHVEEHSTGHSYESLFGRFLDQDVTGIRIEDPYIRSFHQCQNFLRLCELSVQKCPNLREITLLTALENQEDWFKMLASNLVIHKIRLKVEYSTTLHDRQIILSSGWIIKIGRGLDIFKPPENKFTLGMYNLDFRPCHQTTVDIFHNQNVKHKSS